MKNFSEKKGNQNQEYFSQQYYLSPGNKQMQTQENDNENSLSQRKNSNSSLNLETKQKRVYNQQQQQYLLQQQQQQLKNNQTNKNTLLQSPRDINLTSSGKSHFSTGKKTQKSVQVNRKIMNQTSIPYLKSQISTQSQNLSQIGMSKNPPGCSYQEDFKRIVQNKKDQSHFNEIEKAKLFLDSWIQNFSKTQQNPIGQQAKDKQQESNKLYDSIFTMLKGLENRDNHIRSLQRENRDLTQLNEIFQITIKKKDEVYMNQVKENINVRNELQKLKQTVEKQQKRQLEREQSSQFNNIGNDIDLHNSNHNNNKNNQKKPNNIQNNQIKITQISDIDDYNNKNNNNKNEDSNSSQDESFTYQQQNQLDSPRLRKSQFLNENNKNQQTNTSNKSNNKQQTTTKSDSLKVQQENNRKSVLNNSSQRSSLVKEDRKSQLSIQQNDYYKKKNINESKKSPTIRQSFIQHSTDFAFVLTLLDMNINDDVILRQQENNKSISLLKEISSDEDTFKKYIKQLNKNSFESLFESIQLLVQMESLHLNLILKLKKVINSCNIMNSSLQLQDAFNTIIEETCKILQCDRASVFLVDEKHNELWTKVQKGTNQKITVPIGKGFAGYVAESGQLLNVLDAQQDQRYTKEFDLKNKYQTKTTLTIPIYDQYNVKVVGVLQAINKNNGFFLKDDEGIAQILARLAKVVLQNSVYHDNKLTVHNSLRSLLQVGIIFNGQKSIPKLIQLGQQKLIDNFNARIAKIYIYNQEKDNLYTYNYSQQDNGEEVCEKFEFIYKKGTSFCSDIFASGQIQFMNNNYNNGNYNPKIDIDTQLPLVGVPLFASVMQKKQKIGVVQTINQSGIFNSLHNKYESNSHQPYYETLEQFSVVLGQSVYNLLNPTSAEQVHFMDQK